MTAKDYTELIKNLLGVIIQQGRYTEQLKLKMDELKILLSQEGEH